MATITIPKKLIKEKNLILVPLKEYESLLRRAGKKRYTGLDRDLDQAVAEYKAGNFFGPFDTVKKGIVFLKSRKASSRNK